MCFSIDIFLVENEFRAQQTSTLVGYSAVPTSHTLDCAPSVSCFFTNTATPLRQNVLPFQPLALNPHVKLFWHDEIIWGRDQQYRFSLRTANTKIGRSASNEQMFSIGVVFSSCPRPRRSRGVEVKVVANLPRSCHACVHGGAALGRPTVTHRDVLVCLV